MTSKSYESVNVLYIHGVSQIGGAERELLTWLECLDRTRIHPHVVCPQDGPLYPELKKLDIPHASMTLPAWRKLLHVFWRPIAIIRIINAVRRWNIDVLHVNDYWWAPLGIIAGRLTGRPCLVHVRQEIEPPKISQYWLNKGNVLVPVSCSIGNALSTAGVSSEDIHVLWSGVPIENRTLPRPSPEASAVIDQIKGTPVIGTVANLFPRKGLEYLIEAVAGLVKDFPHLVLVIVGKGDEEYERQLKKQVKQLHVTKHALFAGFQEHPECFMAQFDVFVLPSVLEGFGIVLLEAMALGKPVVASQVGGVPEVVDHQKTGILVRPANVEDLRKGLFILCQNPEICQRMGVEAQKRVAERFSLKVMMDRLYGLYEGAVAKG